jgi:hypothetical protein
MKNISFIKILLLILCIGILGACAARTQIDRVSVDDVKLNLVYQNVIFRNFTAAPEVKSPELAIMECTNSSIDYLKLKNVFKKIDKGNGKSFSEPTLYVDVVLTDLRIVSGAARFWGGALSGRSHMKMIAKLSNANGNIIAEKELFGAPNAYGSAYSFGSSDRDLPKNMGILLGDFILANVSKK